MKMNNVAECCKQGQYICRYRYGSVFCNKFDNREQYKNWEKLFHLIDERDCLREFILKFSDDPSTKLDWHKSRIQDLEYIIDEQYSVIMKRGVHFDEVAVYLASTAAEDV
jgi:hypothetical protein